MNNTPLRISDLPGWLKSLPPVVAKSSSCSKTQMEQRKMTIPAHSSIVTPTGTIGHKDGDNGTGEKSSVRERRRVA
jgi:hypothetical protein